MELIETMIRHSDNYKKLFEDFFDDIGTEDIIRDNSEDYDLEEIDNKQLDKNQIVHPKNILKSAEMLPVRLYSKDDNKTATSGRFVKVSYMRTSSAVAYMCVPTKKGSIAPSNCYSKNLAINKILKMDLSK